VDVQVVRAELADKEVLRQLLEFNAYEFARLFDDAELNEHGRFGYTWLDHYWTEPERHPFLIRIDGRIGGMVLIQETTGHYLVSEFLIMPQYRRRGVGTTVARQVFELFGGAWSVHQVPGNEEAVAFWRRAIPAEFAETTSEDGTTQRFIMPH
jgi:predicted acetyltransferase